MRGLRCFLDHEFPRPALFCAFLLYDFRQSFHFPKKIGIVRSDCNGIGVLRTQRLLSNGQRPLVKGLSLLGLALLLVELCQVMERLCHIGMLGSQRFLPDGQGLVEERFSLLVLALVVVEFCQAIET